MPVVLSMDIYEKKSRYLRDLFERTYLKDVMERHKILNNEDVFDTLFHFSFLSSNLPPGTTREISFFFPA